MYLWGRSGVAGVGFWVQGSGCGVQGEADLSWTASSDPDLSGYSVRRSGADPYDTDSELVVDTLPPGTLVLATDEGLGTPGSTMRYKVYVVLTTGNEKGSNTVTIDRP